MISQVLERLSAIQAGRRPSDLESETLDFKRQKAGEPDESLRDIAEAAICFANARGGVIVVGVDDKARGPSAFVGATLAAEDITRRVHELTVPPLLVSAEEHREGSIRLLLVTVAESPQIHPDTRGRATRRVGTNCVPLSPPEHQQIRELKAGVDWSAKTSERTLGEVAAEALAAARKSLSALPDDRRRLARLGDADLLSALGALNVGAGRRTPALTRAGEVLFCAPAAASPSPALLYQYRTTPGGDPKDIQRIDTPLVIAVQRALELINARRSLTPIALPNGQQIEIADFPEGAVREALINAVVHRDHTRAHPVVIEHSPEVLVITSPGSLVAGVTTANLLTHPSAPRNPALAKAMRTLGFAEEVGRGIDRIYREMIRSGRALPRFDAAPDQVRVSLVGGAPNTNVAKFVATMPEDERDDTDSMLVVFRLCSQRTISAEGIAPLLQKTVEEAEVVLRRLATERVALLEPTRQTVRRARPTYRLRSDALKQLGQAVAYQRRTVDETDRKIIAHVREYGKITNKTVQNLFDVGIPKARDILRDLVDREILVKDSEQERGPGVEYGRGPRFPAAVVRKKDDPNYLLPLEAPRRRRRRKR